MSAIEKIINRLASEEYPDDRLMLERGRLVEEARAELVQLTFDRHQILTSIQWSSNTCLAALDRAIASEKERDRLRAERDHWKANHDEMVARNELLRTRPDLDAEQVKPRLSILDELDRLRAIANLFIAPDESGYGIDVAMRSAAVRLRSLGDPVIGDVIFDLSERVRVAIAAYREVRL